MTKQLLNKALIQLLKDGQQVEVPASGLSMYPLLRPGDKLMVIPQLPQKGEIGVFCKQGILIAHRLIRRDTQTFYFKGDGLIYADSPTPLEDVLGTVISRKRKNKLTTFNHPYFKLFKKIIPPVSAFSGRVFFYSALIHHKLFGSFN